jgi:hypothetical protein
VIDELHATFEKFSDDFLKFDRVVEAEKPSRRPDLCAFLRLDKLVPKDGDP